MSGVRILFWVLITPIALFCGALTWFIYTIDKIELTMEDFDGVGGEDFFE